MRLLIGLVMSLIVAIGAYISFTSRPLPVFAATSTPADRFSATGLALVGNRLVAVGELGHILVSEDQGKTWKSAQVKDNRGSALTQVTFFNDKDGVAVGHDAWALMTEDGGLNWHETLFDKTVSEPLLGVWGLAEGPVFAYGSFGRFFVSNDHGRTWEKRESGSGDTHIYAIAGAKDGHLMMVGERGLAMKSTDYGTTWQKMPEFYRGTMFGVIRLSAEEWVAYGLRGNVFLTKDFGATWKQIQTNISVGLFGHTVLEDGTILIYGQGGVVIASNDQGDNFRIVQENKGNNLTAVVALPGGRLVSAALGGIHELNLDAGKHDKNDKQGAGQ